MSVLRAEYSPAPELSQIEPSQFEPEKDSVNHNIAGCEDPIRDLGTCHDRGKGFRACKDLNKQD